MTLADINTPFERRRFIEYGSVMNKAVRHWHEVQHVIGPIYKGRETTNEHGEVEFSIYLLYDGISDGFLYGNQMLHPERYTPEQWLNSVKRDKVDTLENLVADLDTRLEDERFIGNDMILFVQQFDATRAEKYAQHRLNIYQKREEARLKNLQEEKIAEVEALEKERIKKSAERAKLLGWADNMTDMRFGKVMATLETLIRVDGKVMSKLEFVKWAVEDGWNPRVEEGVVSYYGSKWNPKESKPRTEYHLAKNGMSYKVSKTEHDFAIYLIGRCDSVSIGEE